MSQNICTSQELREFANTSEITITELSKFIENKTSQQYVIVQIVYCIFGIGLTYFFALVYLICRLTLLDARHLDNDLFYNN